MALLNALFDDDTHAAFVFTQARWLGYLMFRFAGHFWVRLKYRTCS